MKGTKIQFSAAEMELICDAEIILTKNKVVEKVKLLLEELQNQMVVEIGEGDEDDLLRGGLSDELDGSEEVTCHFPTYFPHFFLIAESSANRKEIRG